MSQVQGQSLRGLQGVRQSLSQVQEVQRSGQGSGIGDIVLEDEDPTAEKRKRELKGDIDYQFIEFDDLPRILQELDGVYTRPVILITGGLTDDNKFGPIRMDANRRLDVISSPYAIAGGEVRVITGTFTKDASGTLGTLIVTPDADDVLHFMYGIITIGSTHAGAASPLFAGISGGDASAAILQSHLQDATADADEVFRFPGLGAATTAAATTSGVYHSLQTAIVGANLVNYDGGGSGVTADPRYIVEYATMANLETFEASLYFLSINNTAPTVAVLLGAWA